jgi:hypothetical protein
VDSLLIVLWKGPEYKLSYDGRTTQHCTHSNMKNNTTLYNRTQLCDTSHLSCNQLQLNVTTGMVHCSRVVWTREGVGFLGQRKKLECTFVVLRSRILMCLQRVAILQRRSRISHTVHTDWFSTEDTNLHRYLSLSDDWLT